MAENNYENYFTSSTYGEDDLIDGGEQIPSAVYVNEIIAKQKEEIEQKADPVYLQPTFPPENPGIGDMWIDVGVFPNIIYAWSGTEWTRASVISAEEVGAYTVGQVNEIFNNVTLDLTNLGDRTATVESKVTDEAIINVITNSQEFKNKADGSVLASYMTKGEFTEQSNLWNAKFETSGGVNMLKNSVGFAELDKWQLTSGSFSQYIGNDAGTAGSGLTAVTGVLKQTVAAVAGEFYTLTLKVRKGSAGTGYVKLSDGTTFQQVNLISSAIYNYTTIQISGFIPANNVLIVELQASGVTGGLIFTDIMLNIGETGFQWSHAPGELYNTNVRADINGLKVFSNVYDGYTVMSPEEFSGYYRNTQGVMQKVFTLNKDTTEVAKLKLTDANAEWVMGSLRSMYINGGGFDGWAIVPIT